MNRIYLKFIHSVLPVGLHISPLSQKEKIPILIVLLGYFLSSESLENIIVGKRRFKGHFLSY